MNTSFFEAQRAYLQAAQRYRQDGTELNRRAMEEAAKRVDQAFHQRFPDVAAHPIRRAG